MRKQTSAMLLVLAVAAVVAYATPAAYADHPTATVSNAEGSSVPGCEETNECFVPAVVTVDIGGEVTWTNDDSAGHTITSGSPDTGGPDGIFDSGLTMPDAEFTQTFEEAGEYPYFCIVHPWMRGMVVVTSAHGEMEDMNMDDSMEGVGMDDSMEGMDDSMEGMDDSMEGMDDSMEGMDDSMEGMDDSMEGMDDSMEGMDDSMEGMTMATRSDGDVSATGMLDDETIVDIVAEKDLDRRVMMITVVFNDKEHVNYDITAVQAGEMVLDDRDAHSHTGVGNHETMPLSMDPDNDPLDITVSFKGYGISEPYDGTPGDVVFTSVVPEFGTIAAMILAVAIVSIIAVSARSRLSLVPRI